MFLHPHFEIIAIPFFWSVGRLGDSTTKFKFVGEGFFTKLPWLVRMLKYELGGAPKPNVNLREQLVPPKKTEIR